MQSELPESSVRCTKREAPSTNKRRGKQRGLRRCLENPSYRGTEIGQYVEDAVSSSSNAETSPRAQSQAATTLATSLCVKCQLKSAKQRTAKTPLHGALGMSENIGSSKLALPLSWPRARRGLRRNQRERRHFPERATSPPERPCDHQLAAPARRLRASERAASSTVTRVGLHIAAPVSLLARPSAGIPPFRALCGLISSAAAPFISPRRRRSQDRADACRLSPFPGLLPRTASSRRGCQAKPMHSQISSTREDESVVAVEEIGRPPVGLGETHRHLG
ncbi:hypothetical protein MRX96_025235 [Rhipicephalus microplus]